MLGTGTNWHFLHTKARALRLPKVKHLRLLTFLVVAACGSAYRDTGPGGAYSRAELAQFEQIRISRRNMPARANWTATDVSLPGVCGDLRIVARQLPQKGARGGCFIANPVSLASVSGVEVRGPSTVNCAAALTLADWVDQSLQPAADRLRKRVASLQVISAYSCRSRDSRRGRVLSEHALGNALDVSAFSFTDGETVSVLKDWKGRNRWFLRDLHKRACGPFSTVLGPDFNAAHKGHFHLDIAAGYARGFLFCK
jgi:hypothetical protein